MASDLSTSPRIPALAAGAGKTSETYDGPSTSAVAMQENRRVQISKEMRLKATDFLDSRRNANNLVDIIAVLKNNLEERTSISPALLALELVFTELQKRGDMVIPSDRQLRESNAEAEYHQWLLERYEEAFDLVLQGIEHDTTHVAIQALVTAMKLLAAECKHSIHQTKKTDAKALFKERLRSVLERLVTTKKSQALVIERFKEYTEYLDVVSTSWKLMQGLCTREEFHNETCALNYLGVMHTLSVTEQLHEDCKLWALEDVNSKQVFNYPIVRKCINRVWGCVLHWVDSVSVTVHKQLLLVLLERILPHCEKPILLTDFLMDSMDCGGPVGMLALQGVFTLIQKHNVSYPNIYEKLYSMFEPEIFHTKYKARLFFLAQIFLSSTHLPESLVAAFVKRLARLSLVAPPQDIVVIIYFIGNLILGHPGLKRLISAEAETKVNTDPFIMDEREPIKAKALDSSLWEIVLLQKHALPSVVQAAKFISQPLPAEAWDLSNLLEISETDIFDQEIAKNAKRYALAFERSTTLLASKNDKVAEHWKLF